jgi:crotonobetainyl-CoA:carnitine CoA-transferase CaiB-like acyl-CoA transferase
MPGPLDGVTVIDFTEYVAGPYGTMMLADMGAEVIKIEPLEGDHWRRHQPVAENESRYFFGVNRGKKSVAVDAETPRGRAVVDDLLRLADVVVLNYRQSAIERLRLDYESVKAVNPAVIYCSITAFGKNGPYSSRPGFDLLVQAMSGIMDFERKVDRGVPIGITTFAPADLSSGMFSAFAIASALYRRALTGEGECIDLSLFASALAIQYRPTLSLEAFDGPARHNMLAAIEAARDNGMSYEDILALRSGMGLQRAAALYYRVYRTKDGLVSIACLNNRQRRRVRDELGMDDPAVDGTAFTPAAEFDAEEQERLISAFEEAFLQRTTDEWLHRFEELDVPAVPVVMTEEVFESEQVKANNLLHHLQHPQLGEIIQARSPIEMRNSEVGAAWPAPKFSIDAREVLGRAGYSEQHLQELADCGILRLPGER